MPPNVVPRRMLDLCRDTLRFALSRNVSLREERDRLQVEVDRLRAELKARDG